MAIYKLTRKQVVRGSLADCWAFFSDPRNLAKITPASLDFTIVSVTPENIYPGLMIEYRVRPLLGIAQSWLSEITHVDAPRYFVDEQRVGPYQVWHHQHFFREVDGGSVETVDLIHYSLPFGKIGHAVNTLLVAPQLKRIFDHREITVAALFNAESR